MTDAPPDLPSSSAVSSGDFSGGWSVPATSQRVYELLESLNWTRGRVLDVGAGTGVFVRVLCEHLHRRGLVPSEHIAACDLEPSSFECPDLVCDRNRGDGSLPYPDATFDIAVSVEVIEHVHDQFVFLREMVRVTRPGGAVIVTTPNTLNINSRIRTLTWGFPLLFDPLPLDDADPRLLDGHIHPISPYFLAYNARREGLRDIRILSDRTKKSGVMLTLLLAPLLLVGGGLAALRLRWKRPEVVRKNREVMSAVSGWRLLTSRTTVLLGRKPNAGR